MDTPSFSRYQLVNLTVLVEGGLFVLALGVGYWLSYPPWEYIRWEPLAVLRGLLATIPMLGLFVLCVSCSVGPLLELKRFADEVVRPLFRQCSIAELAFISLLAGLGEEAVFRAVLQPALTDWTGHIVWGIVLASMLFGSLHPLSVVYFIFTTLMGVYLGWWAYWAGNVLDVIVAHAVYDFVALWWIAKFTSAPPPQLCEFSQDSARLEDKTT